MLYPLSYGGKGSRLSVANVEGVCDVRRSGVVASSWVCEAGSRDRKGQWGVGGAWLLSRSVLRGREWWTKRTLRLVGVMLVPGLLAAAVFVGEMVGVGVRPDVGGFGIGGEGRRGGPLLEGQVRWGPVLVRRVEVGRRSRAEGSAEVAGRRRGEPAERAGARKRERSEGRGGSVVAERGDAGGVGAGVVGADARVEGEELVEGVDRRWLGDGERPPAVGGPRVGEGAQGCVVEWRAKRLWERCDGWGEEGAYAGW
ncbi:hypothetical protein Ssi02_51360 [Sinosporangium siamense]|uniref:Uncharacterized protein n=1 Tax=Sinosporangium siamense TaxID=1367973 RepID=A0A919V7A2_9ACTN|nr:hypothetical protein Ssi02_51360 [Sinosporangium siamense]